MCFSRQSILSQDLFPNPASFIDSKIARATDGSNGVRNTRSK